ncbi:MAG: hypothetical protein ACPGEC_02320 [Flavobacteriales bacterium]
MKQKLRQLKQFCIAAIYIWIGFLAAISFMEAWLKFQAEGVTREIGLSIGSLVFGGLNKVENVLGILILAALFYIKIKIQAIDYAKLIFIPVAIVIVQTFYLLPHLDARAQLIIQGQTIAESSAHHSYVILELIKLISLFLTGRKLLKTL